MTGTYKGVVGEIPTIGSTLLALVPSNIFKAMMEGRFDQVVIVSAVTGVSLLMMPDAPRKRLTTLFQDLFDLMNQLVHIIMILAPYGIFALVAQSVGKYGSAIFGTLAIHWQRLFGNLHHVLPLCPHGLCFYGHSAR